MGYLSKLSNFNFQNFLSKLLWNDPFENDELNHTNTHQGKDVYASLPTGYGKSFNI